MKSDLTPFFYDLYSTPSFMEALTRYPKRPPEQAAH